MRGIVQIFDMADNVLDALEGKPVGSTAAQRSPAPPAGSGASALPARRSPAPSKALARSARSPYRIVESHDGGTGDVRYVVTDGRDRAECNSAEFARKVRDGLG